MGTCTSVALEQAWQKRQRRVELSRVHGTLFDHNTTNALYSPGPLAHAETLQQMGHTLW